MKFCANLSTMFKDEPFELRYAAAARLGFKAVECQFIESQDTFTPLILRDAKEEANVEHILVNSIPGDEHQFGFACLPGHQVEFLNSVNKMLAYTFFMGINKIHILSGLKPPNNEEEDLEFFFVNNFQNIAEMLEEHNIVGLIEPLCQSVKKNYFLSSFSKAIELLDRIDKPNIKLLLDIYHLQEIEGSMVNLEKYYKYAGHIQISQSPNRSEPDTVGKIDFHDVFKRLEVLNHQDYIGLEYWPNSSAAEGLKWLDDYGYKL